MILLILFNMIDLLHERCFMEHFRRVLNTSSDKLQALRTLQCTQCRGPVFSGHDSPLMESVKNLISKGEFSALIEALLPKQTPSMLKGLNRSLPLTTNMAPPPGIQPNTRSGSLQPSSSTVLDVESWKEWYLQQHHQAKKMNVRRVLLNCLTLRNFRLCSRGFSPRHLLVVMVLFFSALVALRIIM